ncbi:unnamed protein product [Linum tenue]|uniref:F-box domain-containing protein n=1 Tax=Linum tenue TaxID=586396 RepID=A0AAV0NK87_9ROSI|nr:unnamed protein product [Linum tenue]
MPCDYTVVYHNHYLYLFSWLNCLLISRMEPVGKSSGIRIGDLPADVIKHILVFLPIKDAARTSVLSRKWRYLRRSIHQLVFDDDFALIPQHLTDSELKVTSKQIMLDIYKCLLVHDGPITKFVLSIPGLCSCDAEVDHVVLYLSSKGVEDLTLVFEAFDSDIDDYRMHLSLFSAPHLKSLTLESCELTPPSWFVGFSKLTHLRLDLVILPDDFFQNFLSKCPMLEFLRVVCCGCPANLEIVAPSLKSFEFVGSFQDICFKCTPLLSFVSLNAWDTHTHEMGAIFASLPSLRQFLVKYNFLKRPAAGDRNVPTRLPIPLHLLEVLNVICIAFDGQGSEHIFFCLIMSSPNLRRLTVQLNANQLYDQPAKNGTTGTRRLLEVEDCSGSSDCLRHLREFRIDHSHGTQVELDLVRFILATAPLLQLIHVTPEYKLSPQKIIKFMKEAMQYTRVSKEAKVMYGR